MTSRSHSFYCFIGTTLLGIAACSPSVPASTTPTAAPAYGSESTGAARGAQGAPESAPKNAFNGVIKLDVRDSKPDWGPYTPKQAPAGAPNFLFVLYDDTGLAA